MTCDLCDGTGYVQAPDLVITNNLGDERRYSQVDPCPCRRPTARKRTDLDDTHLFGDRT